MSIKLGHFELLDQIGKGGMAAVFRAYDPSLNRQVAIKLLDEDLVQQDPQFVEDFIREAQCAATINHPHVVQIYFVGEEKGNYYIAMELLEGRSLDEIIQQQGPLPEGEVLKIGSQVTEALMAAYAKNLIHGDIKPHNIFITNDGNVKLLDFGLAKIANLEAASGEDQTIWGSAYYISPERVGHRAEDFRSDIYSLGATLFNALVGHPPFDADTLEELAMKRLTEKAPLLRQIIPDLSPSTERIIERMLNKSVFLRYLDYDSLLKELRADPSATKAADAPRTRGNTGPADAETLARIAALANTASLAANLATDQIAALSGTVIFPGLPAAPSASGNKKKLLLFLGGGAAALVILCITALVVLPKKNTELPLGTAVGAPAPAPSAAEKTFVPSQASSPAEKSFAVTFRVPLRNMQNVASTVNMLGLLFNEPADPGSLDGVTMVGEGVTGLSPAKYNEKDHSAEYLIRGTLKMGRQYTITVPATLRSSQGVPLSQGEVSTIETERQTVNDFPDVLYHDTFVGKKITASNTSTIIEPGNADSPHSGTKAIKITSSPKSSSIVRFWAGSEDWGVGRIGFDLTNYKAMELWVKGDADTLKFEVGSKAKDGALSAKELKGLNGIMNDQYVKVTLDLPEPRKSIGTLLTVYLPAGKTVYIDDIRLLP